MKKTNILALSVIIVLTLFGGVFSLKTNLAKADEGFLVDSAEYKGSLNLATINFNNGYVCIPNEMQGENNWYALKGKADGYYSTMSFGDETNKGNHWQGTATYNSIWWRQDFAPDGGEDSIAMWRAPYNGTVKFEGKIYKENMASDCDGVTISVFKKLNTKTLSTNLFTQDLTKKFLLVVDKTVTVTSGEMYFFSVGQFKNSVNDTTNVNIKATFTEGADKGELASGSIEPIFSAENVDFITDKQYYAIGSENNYLAAPKDTQGENNFYALYGDVASDYYLMELGKNGDNTFWKGSETYNSIWWRKEYAPDGGDNAILAWRAPFNGTVKFEGKIFKTDMPSGCDGVAIKAYNKLSAKAAVKNLYEKSFNSNFAVYFSGVDYEVNAGEMYFIAVDQLGSSAFDTTIIWCNAIFTKNDANPGEAGDDIGEAKTIDHLSYYGTSQGINDWFYAYGTVKKYVLMEYGFSKNSGELQYFGMEDWQGINAGNMTPGAAYASMRMWVANNDGVISILGDVTKVSEGGDGANAKIIFNEKELFTHKFDSSGNQSARVSGSIENIKVKTGDIIIYYVDSGSGVSNTYDNITFKTEIFWNEKSTAQEDATDTFKYIKAVTKSELKGVNIIDPTLDQNEDYGSGCKSNIGNGSIILTALIVLAYVSLIIKKKGSGEK